ncbi:MAG: EAL domain-containing protein, partial [Hyphomicrobiaceae bacterium]
EALVRNVEALDTRSPTELLQLAKMLGVSNDLDCILLQKAVANFPTVKDFDDALLFVNLDRDTIELSESIVCQLNSLADDAKLDPEDICIEISERSQNLDLPQFAQRLQRVRDAGFKLAIDDFGVGHSGLQMLYEVNPDFIKIDRYFVSQLHKTPKKYFFVSSICKIAHTLGIKVIAEGVETPQEHQLVRDIGCDLMQGRFVSSPTLATGEVRRNYESVALNNDKRGRQDRIDLRSLVSECATLATSAEVTDTFAVFADNPTQSVIPVLDKRGMPLGVVRETDIKPIMYSRFGRDPVANRSYEAQIRSYVRPVAVADADASLDQILQLNSDQIDDGLLLTENMKFIGHIPTSKLLQLMFSHRLNEARLKNPLTGLPSNDSIKRYIETTLAENETKILLYFDFDNFKPFNDLYGFRFGDRAIQIFADILQSQFAGSQCFVGHIGGDDFFVGVQGQPITKVLDGARAAQARFRHEAESLYSPEDRQRGYIEGASRTGEACSFALLTCSVGVVHVGSGKAAGSSDRISQLLAKTKKLAKANPSGLAVLGTEFSEDGEHDDKAVCA